MFKLEESSVDENWIRVKLLDLVNNVYLHIINIYSPQELSEKKMFWAQLMQIVCSLQDEKLCLVGDFNCIRDDSERINCVYRRVDSVDFFHFIDNANLLELALSDSQFTWFGPFRRKSRLDRVFVNDKWWNEGAWSVKTLNRKGSDHKALHVSLQNLNWGAVPFKVYNNWLQNQELFSSIEEALQQSKGAASMNVHSLLNVARVRIKD